MKTCKECRFYKKKSDLSGNCRRRSPTFAQIEVTTMPDRYNETNGCWPYIEKDDWCGDWEQKEEKDGK